MEWHLEVRSEQRSEALPNFDFKVIYNGVTKILHETKMSAKRRKELEQISQEAVEQIAILKKN